jgi:hypothetical protein
MSDGFQHPNRNLYACVATVSYTYMNKANYLVYMGTEMQTSFRPVFNRNP